MQQILQNQNDGKKRGYGKIALVFLVGLLSASAAWAQLTVSGRVTSGEDQSPLPGVNILVKGTTNGTITDATGSYRLPVSSSTDILVFSFVGFVSK